MGVGVWADFSKWEANITHVLTQYSVVVLSLGWHFRAGICPHLPHRNQPIPRGNAIPGGENTGHKGSQPLGDSIHCCHAAFQALVKALSF